MSVIKQTEGQLGPLHRLKIVIGEENSDVYKELNLFLEPDNKSISILKTSFDGQDKEPHVDSHTIHIRAHSSNKIILK